MVDMEMHLRATQEQRQRDMAARSNHARLAEKHEADREKVEAAERDLNRSEAFDQSRKKAKGNLDTTQTDARKALADRHEKEKRERSDNRSWLDRKLNLSGFDKKEEQAAQRAKDEFKALLTKQEAARKAFEKTADEKRAAKFTPGEEQRIEDSRRFLRERKLNDCGEGPSERPGAVERLEANRFKGMDDAQRKTALLSERASAYRNQASVHGGNAEYIRYAEGKNSDGFQQEDAKATAADERARLIDAAETREEATRIRLEGVRMDTRENPEFDREPPPYRLTIDDFAGVQGIDTEGNTEDPHFLKSAANILEEQRAMMPEAERKEAERSDTKMEFRFRKELDEAQDKITEARERRGNENTPEGNRLVLQAQARFDTIEAEQAEAMWSKVTEREERMFGDSYLSEDARALTDSARDFKEQSADREERLRNREINTSDMPVAAYQPGPGWTRTEQSDGFRADRDPRSFKVGDDHLAARKEEAYQDWKREYEATGKEPQEESETAKFKHDDAETRTFGKGMSRDKSKPSKESEPGKGEDESKGPDQGGDDGPKGPGGIPPQGGGGRRR